MQNRLVKTGILFAVVMLAIAAMPAIHAQTTTASVDGALSITDLKVSPNPVIAGDNITVSFRLFNSYSQSLTNVNLALTSGSRIFNVSPANSYLINSVGTGLYGGIGYDVLVYSFHIPSDFQSGLYTIDVTANYQTSAQGSSTALFGESVMPINLYIYGKPRISFNIVPEQPLSPGSSVTIAINAVNTGTDNATNVTARILDSGSFSVAGQNQFNFGKIAAGSSSQVTTGLHVASSVSYGTSNLTIFTSYQGSTGRYSEAANVPISMALGSPNIVVSVSGAAPQQLYSGTNQTLSLLVQNTGDGIARNVTVAANGTDMLSIGSSTSSFFIGALDPGQSATESLLINANTSTGSSAYIPLRISYSAANNQNATSVTQKLGINVAPGAVFSVRSANSLLSPGSAYSPITLSIENIGNEAAKEITFSLQTIYPLSPVSGSAYIGYLAPNSTANATFYVSVDSNGKDGSYPLTIYGQWKQPNAAISQLFTGSNNYFADVSAPKGSGQAGPYAAAAASVIAIIAALLIRKRAKAKRLQVRVKSKG